MAKRKKKLNKKLVIALSVITVMVLLLAVAVGYKKRNYFFPKNPVPLAKEGLEALDSKNYELAVQKLGTAITFAPDNDAESRKIKAKYYYDLGRAYLEWVKNVPKDTDAKKRDRLLRCFAAMREAATLHSTYLEPRQTLYNIYWGFAYGQKQQGETGIDWTKFLEAASAVIGVDAKNHLAYYRRAVAWGSIGENTADKAASEKARADYRKAISLDPENIRYWAAWLMQLKRSASTDPTVNVDGGFLESFEANPKSAVLRIMYASYLRGKNRSDEAAAQLREAIKCEPTSPNGHLAMSRYLVRTKQYDEALKALEEAENIDPDLAEVYLQRSKIHRIAKKLGEAVKALQVGRDIVEPKLSKIAATQPTSRQTRALTEQANRLNFALANAALDNRRTLTDKAQQVSMATIAKECFTKLGNLPENSPHRAKLAGRLAVIRGDRKEAIKNLETAFRAFGLADLQTPALLITLYDASRMPGKSEKVLLMLQNAPRLQDSAEVMLGLARLKIRYQDYEEADNYVNKVLAKNPQNKAALQMKDELRLLMGKKPSAGQTVTLSKAGVRAMVEKIDMQWVDGQQKKALANLVGLRKALPKNLVLAERQINMHLLLNDKVSAAKVLANMSAIYPDNKNLQFQSELIGKTPEERLVMQINRVDTEIEDPLLRALTKMRIATRGGNKEMSGEFLAQAVALKPDNPNVTAQQFRIALQAKNWDVALAVVKRIEKTDARRGKLMRAQMFVLRGMHAKAIEVLEPIRKENPDSKFVLRMLGECYLATQKNALAEDVFGVLESNDPGDVNALIGLAIVTQRLGRMEENERYIMRAHKRPVGRKHRYIHSRYMEIRESHAIGDEMDQIIAGREKIHKLGPGPNNPDYLNNLARLAKLYQDKPRNLTRAEELYREAYERTGRSLQWGRTLAFFYARNGESAKGEAVLKSGISGAKSTAAKVAWHVMHGEFLAGYNINQAMRAFDQASSIDPENPMPFRAKAVLHAKVGKWSKAVENMVAYVSKRSEDIRGRKTLIQYRINNRQYDQAEKELEVLLTANPTDAQALLLKAVMFKLRGSPAKAVSVATLAIEKHPEFAAALSVRAGAYLVMGELEMAKNDLEAARGFSKTPQAAMELADIYMRLGRDGDAIDVLKSVVSEYKTYETALYRLIDTYLKAKDWPNVEKRFADAHKSFPKQANYWLLEAGMWQIRKQNAKAISAYEQAFALNKESLVVVRAYVMGLLEGKQYDKALSVADAYKTKPLWSTWLNAVTGRIMVAKKQDSKADELFAKAVEKASPNELPFVVTQIREAYGPKAAIDRMVARAKQRPNDWHLAVLVGGLCTAAVADPEAKLTAAERNKYLKLSIESYTTSITKTKNSGEVAVLSNRLGKCYYDMGQPREAEKAYKKCLEIQPDNNAALNNLAYLYVDDLNEPKKALPYVQKVIRLRPQDPNVLDTYGWVMGKLKRYGDAKKYLQRSIERDPELAACRYHLGWVFEQTEDRKQAMKHYRLGLELVRPMPHLPLYKRFQDALKRLGE
jgi:tetratricopeptide (TPR) repeat protein